MESKIMTSALILSLVLHPVWLQNMPLPSTAPAAAGTSFQPVLAKCNGTTMCAVDPPSAVLPQPYVGIPSEVPGAVTCGYVCTMTSGCTSYNYRPEQATSGRCELYNYTATSCLASSADSCQHYEISGRLQSCKVANWCPPGYQYISFTNGANCYKFVSSSLVSMSEASANCGKDCNGAYLTRIDSYDEQIAVGKFINDTLRKTNAIRKGTWNGGCRLGSSTNFVWTLQCVNAGVSGNQRTWPMTYTSWLSGQPTASSVTGCVKMRREDYIQWEPWTCTEPLYWVCEYDV